MKLNIILVLAVFLGVAFAATSELQYQETFVRWMKQHERSYSHDKFAKRYQIFKQNMDYINEFNAKGESYTLALNEFADLTNEEFKSLYLGMKANVKQNPDLVTRKVTPKPAVSDVPPSIDWRTSGVVTPVKNQGMCGSCWAFSANGAVEAAHAQATGNLVGLSEQNLVDCSRAYGNEGCNGGWMTAAMQYIIDNKGINTEKSYPYEGRDRTCRYNPANIGANLTAMVNVSTGDENDLMHKVAVGPVSVAIDASATSFQFYSSGVYWSYTCSEDNLNHGVLAVGYGTQSGQDYWIVKNSWGAGWGNKGYILMIRNWKNNCGIATMSTLPIV